MNRFFVNRQAMDPHSAVITGEDVKHISRVLRMAPGDRLMLCDGEGYEYQGKIGSIAKDEVHIKILSRNKCASEPQRRITLYQGLPKAGKMELIIQKCVELGITAIVPVEADRSVVKVRPGEFGARQARYQRVAYEAAKQSGRGIVPRVENVTTFRNADLSGHDLIIVAYEEEKDTSLKALLKRNTDPADIALIIGPEGGLEGDEVDCLIKKGGHSVTLGQRILRTETAGMAVLAMILYEIEG